MKKTTLFTGFTPTVLTTFLLMTIFMSSCRRDDDGTEDPALKLSCNDITSDVVWEDKGNGVDYVVDCIISVRAKLTIAPGVTIQFKNNGGLSIESNGTLVAVGTLTDTILLKGDVDVPGVWRGIYIKSNNVQNELGYCTIANAGSLSFDGNSTKLANIRVALNGKLKINNCTVAKSAKDGLLVDGLDTDEQNPITAFSKNLFKDNQNYPISAIGATASAIDTGSTFINNAKNKVQLRGGLLYGNHVWKKIKVPFLIEGIVAAGYYSDAGSLTIEPGVVVQFAGDAGLCTGNYSTNSWMRIVGTATERITLTGESAAPGAWKGIAFQSTSPNNVISYLDISYGGSSSYTGATSKRSNILAGGYSAGSFTITNSTVTNSEAWGIYVSMASPDITVPASVTYSGNALGNYYKE